MYLQAATSAKPIAETMNGPDINVEVEDERVSVAIYPKQGKEARFIYTKVNGITKSLYTMFETG